MGVALAEEAGGGVSQNAYICLLKGMVTRKGVRFGGKKIIKRRWVNVEAIRPISIYSTYD